MPCPAKATIRNVLTPVYGARQTSRRKKGCTSADTEGKHPILEKEPEAERTKRIVKKTKLFSRFNTELRRQAEGEVQTLQFSVSQIVKGGFLVTK